MYDIVKLSSKSRSGEGQEAQSQIRSISENLSLTIFLVCSGKFQLKFTSPSLYYSELKTQQSFQAYLSLTVMRVNLVYVIFL